MPKIEPTILSPTGVDLDLLDSDAVRATQRLASRGFEAFLVGGCVRDHLLGRSPKDYDIATSARPQQVKRTFPRNCRIIGRRFKLAHLHFDRNTKILEVSTFRRTPEDEGGDDLLITRDNEFGNAEEDALRRDFTVNALFFDPTKDRIIDWCDGLTDLEHRVIRTIGDPRVRFREDPIRILRAAKFAGRLGFSIEPETFAAMAETASDLTRAAPPRVLEEILRLLRGGHALDSFQLLRDVGALKSLVPALADFLAEADHQHRVDFWRLLEALDQRVQGGDVPQSAVLLGVLLVGPVLAAAQASPDRSPSSIAEELLGSLGQDLKLPRRDAGCLKRICGVQHRFVQSDSSKRFRTTGFVRGPYFAEALELFELRVGAEAADADAFERWLEIAEQHGRGPSQDPDDEGDRDDDAELDEPDREAPKRRRRRRAKKPTVGSSGQHRAKAAADDASDVLFGEPSRAKAPPAEDDESPHDRGIDDDVGQDDDHYREHDRGPDDSGDADEPRDDELRDDEPRDDDAAEVEVLSDEDESRDETGGRRRRRRRRRRRSEPADDDDAERPEPAAAGDDDEEDSAAVAETTSSDREDAEADESRPRRRRRRRRGKATGAEPKSTADAGGPDREAAPARSGRKARAKQPSKGDARKSRRREPRRSGGGRDVDVVPRSRDRRGKVEVIEPPPLDVSAFDVELDPKRVPTFGTIVEGKGRPKRRTPRVRDDGVDDYKPPPPPGSGGGDAPPPPRNSDDSPDTFGDW